MRTGTGVGTVCSSPHGATSSGKSVRYRTTAHAYHSASAAQHYSEAHAGRCSGREIGLPSITPLSWQS